MDSTVRGILQARILEWVGPTKQQQQWSEYIQDTVEGRSYEFSLSKRIKLIEEVKSEENKMELAD